jgi:copper chaperone CopZ
MNTKYQSPAEAAAEIRGKLKKLYGITSRQVSVRCASFSMGSSLDVTINDPAVDIREVRNVADSKEKISRCEMTGEILSGGNRYLDVRYGKKAAEAFAAANAEALAKLVSNLPAVGSGTSGPEVEIDGKRLIVCRADNGCDLIVRDVTGPESYRVMPAWLPREDYLAKPEGKVCAAESILAMRQGRA